MRPVVCEERVGGRAGTAASKGVVCELPNPPSSSLQNAHVSHSGWRESSKNRKSMKKWEGDMLLR
jgi:hypothetical protein